MFDLTGQFVSLNFAKLQKQSLSFAVDCNGTFMLVTRKEMLCLKETRNSFKIRPLDFEKK